MALKVTLDFDNLTVAEVLRFADAIRASNIAETDAVEVITYEYDGQVSPATGLSVVVSADALG
jgi:hypothetical protein